MVIIQEALNIIETHLLLELSLESIAKELHYSKFHLSRKFNTRIGISIPSYIKLRRLCEAVRLIDVDEYQINDIAFKCGFNSASYFTKMFKEKYGLTPKEYSSGNHYIKVLERINLGGKEMYGTIEGLNDYIFANYHNYDDANHMFANIDNCILISSENVHIEYIALLDEKEGHILWQCKVNMLTGVLDKKIIENDNNTPRVSMTGLHKENDICYVDIYNSRMKEQRTGKLVHVGMSEYLVDICRIDEIYFDSIERLINEPLTEEQLKEFHSQMKFISNIKNNIELRKYVESTENISLLRMFDSKILVAYLINSSKTIHVVDALIDMKEKSYSSNNNFSFNNFGKVGSLFWNDNMLEIRLDKKYFAELRLGQGELYHLYNSSYAIEFGEGLSGLSSIFFDTMNK